MSIQSSLLDRGGVLPASPTKLVGRETEVAVTGALLRDPDVRLMTLTGPGGVGKTRLALAVADALDAEFADGACFVPLAAVADLEMVVPALADVFGVRETGGRPLAEALVESMRRHHCLLVLDNFEQVVAAAPVVQPAGRDRRLR